uniref:Far upstream element binding protein 3 n=1 Tax=Oncorhynchus mykiss TaxID=8022 RepID=A0A8C7QI27_ONCMY
PTHTNLLKVLCRLIFQPETTGNNTDQMFSHFYSSEVFFGVLLRAAVGMMMMAELVQGQASVAQPGTKADGFADALHRARQIAAKMGGDQMPHMNNSSPVLDPSLYGYGGQKRSMDDGGKSVVDLFTYLHTQCMAIMTEDFKVPDKMVGFIIGRGGEQITRIQLESGCKIQIAAESGGMMDRPCTLTGSPENIEQAKRLLSQIVDRCRNGPGFHSEMDGNSAIQEILIPASKVGLVIGKGGDTIKQLQERTGVKMIMIQDGPMPTGADKPLRITGDPYKVQQARELVVEIIRDKDQGDFRANRGDFGSRLGGSSLDVAVPRFAVGIVIGRNGEMIKKIQNDSGVRIQFKPDDGISPDRIAQVMGQPDRCQHAVHLINELVHTAQDRDGFGGLVGPRGRGRGRGDWSMGAPGGLQEVTYTIPADKCGLVIGKGGETIKNINQQSGAHVELQRNPPPNTDPNVRIFSIRGTSQQMEMARQLIDEKIGVGGLMPPSHKQTIYSLTPVHDYLSDRTQAIVVDGVKSEFLEVCEGVPQGSILGPVFYTIYSNAIGQSIPCNFYIYIFASTADLAVTRQLCSKPLLILKLILNTSKTK